MYSNTRTQSLRDISVVVMCVVFMCVAYVYVCVCDRVFLPQTARYMVPQTGLGTQWAYLCDIIRVVLYKYQQRDRKEGDSENASLEYVFTRGSAHNRVKDAGTVGAHRVGEGDSGRSPSPKIVFWYTFQKLNVTDLL